MASRPSTQVALSAAFGRVAELDQLLRSPLKSALTIFSLQAVNVLHSMPGPSTTLISVLIDQVACVGLLMIALLALTDKCNTNNGKHQAPIGKQRIEAAPSAMHPTDLSDIPNDL